MPEKGNNSTREKKIKYTGVGWYRLNMILRNKKKYQLFDARYSTSTILLTLTCCLSTHAHEPVFIPTKISPIQPMLSRNHKITRKKNFVVTYARLFLTYFRKTTLFTVCSRIPRSRLVSTTRCWLGKLDFSWR